MSGRAAQLPSSPYRPYVNLQRARFDQRGNSENSTDERSYCKVRLLICLLAASSTLIHRADSQEVAVPAENPRVFASIEETYNTFRQAMAEQDVEGMWNCYSPELQVEECFELYIACMMRPNDPEIARILKAHAINPQSINASYLKRYHEKHGVVGEPQRSRDDELLMQVVGEAIVDQVGFYKELKNVKAVDKPTSNTKPTPSPFEALRSIAVNGDSAEGTAFQNSTLSSVFRDENGVERVVHQKARSLQKVAFTCHQGKWVIRGISPAESNEPPQVGAAQGVPATVVAPPLEQVAPPASRRGRPSE